MFLSKNLLQTVPKSSLFSLASRGFSSDVGKINEKYNKKMVDRLAKSHESLSLPNITLQDLPQHRKPIPFQASAAKISNRVKSNKFAAKIPAIQDVPNDFSLEIEKLNETMLSIVSVNK